MIMALPQPRLERRAILAQKARLDHERLGLHVLNELPTPILLVNRSHQIVTVNRALCTMTGSEAEEVLGQRPGDVIRCENSEKHEDGCGCSEPCAYCGAVSAILASFRGESSSRECRINRKGPEGLEALDLMVSARRFHFENEAYALVHLADISAEKRRKNLEQIFFHDILNVIGSIRGFAEILLDYDLENPREILAQLHEASLQMIDEVEAQRLLARAEQGDLVAQREPVETLQVLERVVATLQGHEVARDRVLTIDAKWKSEIFLCDPTLLIRSLVNLAKNALEASPVGGTVTLSCGHRDGRFVFHVHNEGVMSDEVQQQVFQRSFSTKGSGRGVGTYSVRLLVERYLAGRVSFVSDNAEGTRFTISVPE